MNKRIVAAVASAAVLVGTAGVATAGPNGRAHSGHIPGGCKHEHVAAVNKECDFDLPLPGPEVTTTTVVVDTTTTVVDTTLVPTAFE